MAPSAIHTSGLLRVRVGMSAPRARTATGAMRSDQPVPAVCLVHPDRSERGRLHALIARHGLGVRDFPSADAFLRERATGGQDCLVVDLPTPLAFDLLERLATDAAATPTIVIGGSGDVPTAVRAMRAGACAFIQKPYTQGLLMKEIRRAFARGKNR